MRAFYEAAGVPSTVAQTLAAIDEAIASGIENRTTDIVARITDSVPRSFRAFAVAEFSL